MATDWLKLQNEYLSTPLSLRALAEKYGVSRWMLQKRAAQEGWAPLKQTQRQLGAKPKSRAPEETLPTAAPEVEETAASPSKADRLARLSAIGDSLTDQLARAAGELNRQVIRHKRKTREVVYGGEEANGKPVEETVEEHTLLEVVPAPVSSAGLQRLSTALKNLRAAALADSGNEQSVEMIENLMKKLDAEAGKPASGEEKAVSENAAQAPRNDTPNA